MEKNKITPEKHKITNVTVYFERVLITRELKINLDKNSTVISFDNLSHEIDKDTIRVSCTNTGGIKILGIDVINEYLELYTHKKINALEKDILENNFALEEINADIELIDKNNELANKTLDFSCGNFYKELYFKKSAPADLNLIADIYRKNFNKNTERYTELLKQRKEINKKIIALKYELKKIKQSRHKSVINCNIPVEVSKPGEYSFYLTYIIRRASWYPVYDVKVLFDSKELEISYYGMISQTTGENWNSVKTVLSTSSHALSAFLPELEAKYLDFELSSGSSSDSITRGMSDFEGIMADKFEKKPKAVYDETVIQKGLNVSFAIKEPQDLEGNGSEKKVLIARRKFTADFSYRVLASKVEAAFIMGEFENTETFPLLKGGVKIYHESDYIGDGYMERVLPGEKTKISLGVDEQISVRREQLKHFTGKKTFSKDTKQTQYKFNTTIKNHKKREINISVQEVLPTSKNKEIKVNIDEVTDKVKPDYKGVLFWEFKLAPSQEKELLVEYHVEYPSSKIVTGLI